MQIDRFTKTCLLAITIVLTILLARPELEAKENYAAAGGRLDVQVLCSMCIIPGGSQFEGHLVLLDSRTGDIWAYSYAAIVEGREPIYLGTLTELGKPVKKKDKIN